MTFKDHFSGHASDYAEARPAYPAALFDWLAAEAPDRELVWDAGCGNGQAAVSLAERFTSVYATDPSANQIARGEARPNIDYRVEAAEQCSLQDESVSLVTVAQAMHWFDIPAFYAEVRRVLKPRGVFAAWTYADCRVTPAIDALKNRVYIDLVGPYWPPERELVDSGYRTLPFPFEPLQPPPFTMNALWTADRFLAYLRSWSATQRYIEDKSEDPVASIESALRSEWGGADVVREVRWDFHLRCGRR